MKLYRICKRTLDIILGSIALLLLSPVFLLIALALFITEGRPLLYTSSRHIKPDKTIKTYKFRSMVRNATDPAYQLHERYMRDGYLDIPLSCEVYTPVGRFLEQSQLVESLQLVNVLKDKMSLVGNRPLPRSNIELMKKYPGWEKRFDSPCGLTGITQIVGKFNLGPEDRLELEKLYTEIYHKGNILKCDFWIVWYTIKFILFSKPLSLIDARKLLNSCLK